MIDRELNERLEALEDLWIDIQVLKLRGAILAYELSAELAEVDVDQ